MALCRIALERTDYSTLAEAKLLKKSAIRLHRLEQIFYKYCEHKKFTSVQPLFPVEFLSDETDVIEYSHDSVTVAFSILRKYSRKDVEAVQFAWDYASPRLRLGIRSLEHECAFYKSLGYEYLYLGESAPYKEKMQGYEELVWPP